MTITLNGESREVREGMTLAELVGELGMARSAYAAEVNGRLVPRASHATWSLSAADRVEIVVLVGGG
jgi:sulfur carrier protein